MRKRASQTIDWHVGTKKYLHLPEEPEDFIELLTEHSLHVINGFYTKSNSSAKCSAT